MRCFLKSVSVLLLTISLVPGPASARAAEATRKHHPWATFSPGAWRQVRVYTKVFDKDGKVVDTGVTEKTTTLEKVDDHGVTLQVEESVWGAGKWLDGQPATVKQGIYGESEGQKATIKDLEPEMLVIEGRKIPCGIRQVEVADANNKRLQVSKLYFNDDVAPFVLKRETTIKDLGEKAVLSESKTSVNALRMPCLGPDELFTAAHLRATTKHARGMTVTLAYTSAEVPGGIVRQCTKKVDKENRLVEQCVLELTDYGLTAADKPRRRLFPLRSRESRKRAGRRNPDK